MVIPQSERTEQRAVAEVGSLLADGYRRVVVSCNHYKGYLYMKLRHYRNGSVIEFRVYDSYYVMLKNGKEVKRE